MVKEMQQMGITDRLKFIARSYMNSARRKGHELFDQPGLSSLEDENNEMSLEEQVRRTVEAEIKKENNDLHRKSMSRARRRKFNDSKTTSSRSSGSSRSKNTIKENRERKINQHYANLELAPGAPIEDVHKAWRKLILKYHPDRHAGDKTRIQRATRISQIINSSYSALLEHLERK